MLVDISLLNEQKPEKKKKQGSTVLWVDETFSMSHGHKQRSGFILQILSLSHYLPCRLDASSTKHTHIRANYCKIRKYNGAFYDMI